MFSRITITLLALSSLALGSPYPRRPKKAPACQDLLIPVTVAANNIQLPSAINPRNPLDFLSAANPNDAVFVLVNGTYQISARYCEPEVTFGGRINTLQILGHGNTYDKTYWSGLGFPGYQGDEYSWMAYASQHGYPTLAMDRLGNGNSSHPDPVSVVQLPTHIEILHHIVNLARTGKLASQITRSFDNVVYAGHSYGSFVGNGLAAKYPSDIDAYILTGFTNQPLQLAAPGIQATARYLPAALVNPTRFANLPLGYLAGSSKPGRETVFYTRPGVDYDPQLFELDWKTAGTLTVGEAATESFSNAAEYTGSVFVLTGQNDTIFCGFGTGDGDCGKGEDSIPARTKALYPNVMNFGYFIPENVGHDWNFHFGASEGFQRAHSWLASVGF